MALEEDTATTTFSVLKGKEWTVAMIETTKLEVDPLRVEEEELPLRKKSVGHTVEDEVCLYLSSVSGNSRYFHHLVFRVDDNHYAPEDEDDALLFAEEDDEAGNSGVISAFHKTVQDLFEEEEDLLNLHMSVIQENAELLTEEGRLLQSIQGENNDIDAYATRLDQILTRKQQLVDVLQAKLDHFRRSLQKEETFSKAAQAAPSKAAPQGNNKAVAAGAAGARVKGVGISGKGK